ncbi:HNH endonuclease signature motif containing protein [Hafnia paralvei]|uniref:HNH endonuclease signature motif containing protein n=1 Tax=Hafnia paralvei TaxID=546367 RepID=UPI0027B8E004|nr:HNH endonuclease signature motif containing protein [Hafnia paralvei]
MNWNELFDYRNGNLFWKVQRKGRAKKGDKAGYVHHRGYSIVKVNGVLRPVHRIIWEMHYGTIPKNMEIDHINRIKVDNRIDNLRLATRRQNACNISTNTSGVPGVYWCKQQCKWRARIFVDGKYIHLGLFQNLNDAAAARRKAEADLENISGAIKL